MTKKRKISHVKRKKVSKEIDLHIKTLLSSNLFVVDQRINSIISEMIEIKTNLMTTQNLLEKNKFLEEKEFYKEYEIVSKALLGDASSDGKLIGNPIFSLYDA